MKFAGQGCMIGSLIRYLAEILKETFVGINIEFLLVIIGTLMNGFVLYARVSNGQCDASISLFDTQSCNPVADNGSIPPDQVLLLLITPLIVQLLARGVSIQTLVLCWVLAVLFIVASMIKVGSLNDVWSLLYTAFFLNISMIAEKGNRIVFLEGKRTASVERKRLELHEEFHEAKISAMQKEHEIILLSIHTEEEKRYTYVFIFTYICIYAYI
jgi:hypothetical protein